MRTAKPVTKPNKQRKMLYEAPDHVRHRLLAAHLSPELRASHLVKSLPVRSGDTVRVMRGDHKGFEGKITRIDLSEYRIYVEGLTREKVDGTTVFVPIHPSKVMVTHLNLDDKWRKKILERKKEVHKKPKEAPSKPKAKIKEKPLELEEEKEAEKVKEPVPEKAIVEEKPAVEEKPTIERKMAAREKPRKKKPVKEKPAAKKKVAEKVEPEKGEKTEKLEKPKTEKKKTRRKTAKKSEEGGE
jgi:large subunit ribosomal protein L24